MRRVHDCSRPYPGARMAHARSGRRARGPCQNTTPPPEQHEAGDTAAGSGASAIMPALVELKKLKKGVERQELGQRQGQTGRGLSAVGGAASGPKGGDDHCRNPIRGESDPPGNSQGPKREGMRQG